MDTCTLNTSADSKWFWALLNLIGSVHRNAPEVERIIVWDLGLTRLQKFILSGTTSVELHHVPPFVRHWKACYTWKLYVYKHSPCEAVFHLDAGNTVLKGMAEIFAAIHKDGSFCVGGGHHVDPQTPEEYWALFGISRQLYGHEEIIHAGNFGFLRGTCAEKAVNMAYERACEGYTLGFSAREQNRDVYGIGIVRNCEIFRHDQTLLNLAYRKFCGSPRLRSMRKYAWALQTPDATETIILNHRSPNRVSEIQFVATKNKAFSLLILMSLAYMKARCIVAGILPQSVRKLIRRVLGQA